MNGTGRTSRKHKSKQQNRRGARSNQGQTASVTVSKKQQAILNAPVKLGDEVLVSIHGIGSSGEGVGRVEDFTVFVPFALPGETVKVVINMVKKTYATGRLLEIVTMVPNRIDASCELYGFCGGCQLQHITYEGQLSLKTQKVKDVIKRIGHQNPDLVKPALGPKEPWAYRNKMQMPVGGTKGDIQMGFYAMDLTISCKAQTVLFKMKGIISSLKRVTKSLKNLILNRMMNIPAKVYYAM